MLNLMGTKATSTQRLFRQRSPLGLAALSTVTGLFLLVSLARSWAQNPQPLFAAWVLLGLAVAWSLFVRPAVLLDDEGVTIRNVVRDVHIPWTRLTDVTSRWNLKVFVGDRGYGAWAISAHERPKNASGGMFAMPLPGPLRRLASGDAQASDAVPKINAETVARSITTAKQEYDEAAANRHLPASPEGTVRVTWARLAVVVLLVPAVVVLAMTLL